MLRQKGRHLVKTRFCILFLAFFLISFLAPGTYGESKAESREYHLKAAFLRYVVKYVTWPPAMNEKTSWDICVFGDVPSLEGLRSITGKVVNGKPIIVRELNSLNDVAKSCHILFVSKEKDKNIDTIIKQFENDAVLTFGDMDGFAQAGGDMNFFIVNNNLGIMINQTSVKDSYLTISPKMLRLVTIIPPIEATTGSEELFSFSFNMLDNDLDNKE